MTSDEKYEVLLNHCKGKPCDESCLIKGVCTPVTGRFKENPDALEEAYRILRPDDNDDKVNHPSHYNQGGIECIDAMVSAFGKEAVGNFCICNAFKYVWRTKQKNGIEDVDKAVWYLTKYKELTADEAV